MRKILLINLIIFFSLVVILEISARLYLKIKNNNQNMGLPMKNMNLKYQPFVMYGPNWQKIFATYNAELNKDDFNILLIGGSTAADFPSEILETALSSKLNLNVKVFNAAYGGYISTQELIILTKYGKKLKPDLVININGANDIIHSIRANAQPGTFYLNSTYKILLNKPYLGPFVKILQNSQLLNGLTRFKETKVKYKTEKYIQYLEIYLDNINSMAVFCDGLGIPYINILQPHLLYKDFKSKKEKNFTLLNYRNNIVRTLYEKVKEKANNHNEINKFFFDATFIFENNKELIFSDDVHFMRAVGGHKASNGYTILADFISKINILKK